MAWRESHGLEGGEANVDSEVITETTENVGAGIMGRKMFSGGSGGWEDDPNPRGWWGEEPPFHVPVFVLTHTPRPSIEFANGTVFHFLEASPEEALARATDAASGGDVRIGGGPTTIRPFLKAGLVDHLHVAIAPILLGRGIRLWDELRGLEAGYTVTAETAESGTVHLTFAR
jgi:dihydrofolate reductase